MSKTLGTRIKELRQLTNISQEELGNQVGVQKAAIQKYEKGTVQNISIHTIEKLAEALQVQPSYLLGWSSDSMSDLAMEVKILQGIKHFYGDECVQLVEGYTNLNQQGKKRLSQYLYEIAQIY